MRRIKATCARDQSSTAAPTVARLVNPLRPILATGPDPVGDHPLAKRLHANREAVQLEELLRGKRGTEIGVTVAQ